jgi:hypothetical protein
LLIQGRDRLIDGAPLRPQALDQPAQHGAELVRVGFEQARQRLLQAAPAACHGDRALEQKAPDLVDQRGAHPDQPVARPVQRRHVELRRRLDRHKAHLRPLHRLADRLRVGEVVLVRLDDGLTYWPGISRTSWPCAAKARAR